MLEGLLVGSLGRMPERCLEKCLKECLCEGDKKNINYKNKVRRTFQI